MGRVGYQMPNHAATRERKPTTEALSRRHSATLCLDRLATCHCYRLLLVVLLLPFAFVQTVRNCGPPWYLRSLIRQALRKVEVILLHHVERGLLGEPAVILGK
jgi:hypothetical protein